MKREEHKTIINSLLGMVAPEHQATASEQLTKLTEDYEEVLTASENLTTANAELAKNNETLRNVNAKLFLKVGETENPNKKKEENENHDDEGKEKISFDDLFDEKGGLK